MGGKSSHLVSSHWPLAVGLWAVGCGLWAPIVRWTVKQGELLEHKAPNVSGPSKQRWARESNRRLAADNCEVRRRWLCRLIADG